MTDKNTSVDLAQLDKLREEFEALLMAEAVPVRDDPAFHHLHRSIDGVYSNWVTECKWRGFQLARRSLTSGSPVEPIYQAEIDGNKWIDIEAKDAKTWRSNCFKVRIVYAAPVHNTAAPSAEAESAARLVENLDITTVKGPYKPGEAAYELDQCAKAIRALSAGAAAKTDHAPTSRACETYAYVNRVVKEKFNSTGQASAAGAGSDQAFPERDTSKQAEQQGLFRKFDVRRLDGSDQPGGKHYGCRYYVLDLTHDQHAPAAMRAYAAACRSTHPQLANDIETEFNQMGTVPMLTMKEAFEAVGGWYNGGETGYPSFGSANALWAYTDKMQRNAVARSMAATPSPSVTVQDEQRNPTEAMLNAARDWSVKKYGIGIGNDAAIGCWQAMFDALAHPVHDGEKDTKPKPE